MLPTAGYYRTALQHGFGTYQLKEPKTYYHNESMTSKTYDIFLRTIAEDSRCRRLEDLQRKVDKTRVLAKTTRHTCDDEIHVYMDTSDF